LISKAIVVLGTVGALATVSVLSAFVGNALVAYTRIPNVQEFDHRILTVFGSTIACMGGVAWGVSSLMSSNGVPILLGLFSPLFALAMVRWSLAAVGLTLTDENVLSVVNTAVCLLGIVGIASGSFWYLNRSEP